MLAAYIVAAIVGGGMIAFSALAGAEAHHDIGGDVGGPDAHIGHDADHGHDSHESGDSGSLWLPFLSLRFWTYLIGTFGLMGLVLTLSKASPEPMTGIISGACGLVMGTFAAGLVRYLSKSEQSAAVSDADFVGALGKVTVGIHALPGKVRTSVKGDVIDVLALGENGEQFEQGEEVMIVGFEGQTAKVVRKDDYLGE